MDDTDTTQRKRQRRPRPRTTCAPCHQRKVKCNQQKPCDQCMRQNRDDQCHYPDGIPRRRESTGPSPAAQRVTSSPELQSSTAASRPAPAQPAPGRFTYPYNYSPLVPQSDDSTALTHVWSGEFPIRGRSHYSWLLDHFNPLLSYARDTSADSRCPDPLRAAENGAYDGHDSSVTPGKSHEHHAQHIQAQASSNVYDELPSREVAKNLFERYFDTFNKVCPILYRPTFETAFDAMLENPRSVKICFVMETLMVLALGNATLPVKDQVITQEIALGWLDLASSAPSTAMDLREFDIDTVRMWALINYARQLLKFDPVADYIFTGSALRAGMVIGLHRPSAWEKGGNRRGLWEALVGLDLQACLASGSPPSLPWLYLDSQLSASEAANLGDDDSTTRRLSDIRLGRALSRSLSVRYKIAHLLNVETHARFDTANELGRELTKIMAPAIDISSGEFPYARRPFQHRFVSGIYNSFLAAVHRPFATIDIPAYYYSRSISVTIAQQHLEDVIDALESARPQDHFDRLLAGRGSLFKLETYQAVLLLCFHVYHTSEDQLAMQAAGISINTSQKSIMGTIVKYLKVVQAHVEPQESLAQPYLIASLLLCHVRATATGHLGIESAQYKERMTDGAAQAMRWQLLPGAV